MLHPARMYAAIATSVVVGACATPREQCISQVTQDLRATQAALVTAQENVARGYALHREQEPYTVYQTCFRTNANGARIAFPCPQTYYRTKSTPVAIDVSEERRKARALQKRLATEESQARAGVAQCNATYPAQG